jgi:hypothetical protein
MDATGEPCFVPGADIDVFVSYGHLDNAAEQWVTKLHLRLKSEVEGILGETVNFWMDPQLSGGEILDTSLKRRVSSSALFLPILSPRYVKSSYCCQEMQWFFEAASQSGALCVGDHCRVIPVEKYPPPELPAQLAQLNLVSTRFHSKDATSQLVSTFPADENLPGFPDFYRIYKNLAANLATTLTELRKARSAAQDSKSKTIFVAAAVSDKKMERERLVNYLTGKGYAVSGAQAAPETMAEVVAAAEQDLGPAVLAIHLIGKGYGVVPEGEDNKSAVWLQYEQAKKTGKRQLVWISKETEPPTPRQQAFLDVLGEAGDQQTEVFHTCFSEFLDALPEELAKLEEKPQQRDSGIYVICDRGDLADDHLKALRSFLEQKGFPVVHPSFQGDAGLLRELEEESIAASGATVIYYGSAPDAWVMLKRRTVLKVLQTIKEPRYPARALYLCEPPDDIKKNMYLGYSGKMLPEGRGNFGPLLVLGDCSSFQPEKVKPLLDILEHHA